MTEINENEKDEQESPPRTVDVNELEGPQTPSSSDSEMVDPPLEEVPSTAQPDQDSPAEESIDNSEGFEIYDPLEEAIICEVPSAEESNLDTGLDDEWRGLGERISVKYGDSLSGMAGVMGPVGVILSLIGGVVIIFHSFNELGIIFLTSASVALIIGLFLLLFHSFHWMSNRAKGRELAYEMDDKLMARTCVHLDISSIEGNEMLLRCDYFMKEISEVPECILCEHYSPSSDDESWEPSGENAEEGLVEIQEDPEQSD